MSLFQRYTNTQKTNLSWAPVIPAHWSIKRAKFIFKLNKREPLDTDDIVTAFRDGQVTLRSNRRTDGFTNSFKEIGYQRVLKGDLVIHAMDAFAGAVGVSDSDGKCTPVYSCCTPTDAVDTAFYARMVRSMALSGYIESLSKGIRERSTEFRWREFSEQALPIPPIEEQREINLFLDRETSRIDFLIQKKSRFIQILREKRQAIVTQAVTKGLNSSAPMVDSGVEWLGLVPVHWKIMRCSNFLFEIKRKNDLMQSENYLSLMANRGVIPYAEKGDIGNKKPEDLSKCKLVEVGDFVINSMNYSIGSYGRSNYRGICSPVYVILRHREDFVESDYVDLILSNSSFQQYAQSFGTGILDHRRAIGWDEIKKISVAIPPIEEQIEISQKIHRETRKINSLIKKTEESISLLIEHRSALIAAAVTGKIDVRISR